MPQACELLQNDGVDRRDFTAAAVEIPRYNLRERIEIVQEDIFEGVHDRIDVPGNAEIDQKHWCVRSCFQAAPNRFDPEDVARRGDRRNDHVHLQENTLELVERYDRSVKLVHQLFCSRLSPVGDEERGDTAVNQVFGGQLSSFACTYEEYLLVGQVRKDLCCQLDSCIAGRDCTMGNAGLGPGTLADVERCLEKAVQMYAGCVLVDSKAIMVLDLAEDLYIANDHRINAACHFEKVSGGMEIEELV